jgi:hypothetical protein
MKKKEVKSHGMNKIMIKHDLIKNYRENKRERERKMKEHMKEKWKNLTRC